VLAVLTGFILDYLKHTSYEAEYDAAPSRGRRMFRGITGRLIKCSKTLVTLQRGGYETKKTGNVRVTLTPTGLFV
jgi:hypothetical protein